MYICRCYHGWDKDALGKHCWSCNSDIIEVDVTNNYQERWSWIIKGVNKRFYGLDDVYNYSSFAHLVDKEVLSGFYQWSDKPLDETIT
jgi:hypothetical protein